MKYNPEEDGITHINIYSKGKTQLGKYLSNWEQCWINTSLGEFKTIEGFIFFLGSFDNSLRNCNGFQAKTIGEKVDRNIRLPEDIFKKLIIEAMKEKVEAHNHLKSLLSQSDLPFTHYYNYGGKIIEIKKWEWQVTEWENIRKELKSE